MKNQLILGTIASTFLSVAPFTASSANALTITFNSDPFAGSTALTTPGRQAVGVNELTLPSFNVATDVFAFDQIVPAYSAVGKFNFYNGLASGITNGANIIVLQDTDNDANPATPFNAGTAASLIASVLPDTVTPGIFVYFNSALNVNRLVYSTDLTVATADISILARISSPTGQVAIDTLPTFTSSNFVAIPVPFELEPALGLVILGVAHTVQRRFKSIVKK